MSEQPEQPQAPRLRVIWVPSLRVPSAPKAEEIAAGVELTRDDRPEDPADLSHLPPLRFKVTRWPTGRTDVEPVDTPDQQG